ncbi:hypothetical protein DUI87_08176 [Hirundo rustica rustica]|uniref:Uncharacterized protein n=1 Tax=Hirundo rustica rustica TaxID=333673 RepID=A0A3M0KRQ3_HIRRU|nr:hypothetical protein DUI87_08176 [Hirundo rustica rustica]
MVETVRVPYETDCSRHDIQTTYRYVLILARIELIFLTVAGKDGYRTCPEYCQYLDLSRSCMEISGCFTISRYVLGLDTRSSVKIFDSADPTTEPSGMATCEWPPPPGCNPIHQHSSVSAIKPVFYSANSGLDLSSQFLQENAAGDGIKGFTKVQVNDGNSP